MRAALLAVWLAAPAAAQSSKGHVGLSADWHKGELVVVTVREGSPADQAGVRHGDRILSIAGKAPTGNADAKRLAGPVGTEVRISVRARGQAARARTLSLFREELPLKGKNADNSEELEAGAAAGDPVSLTYYALELMHGHNGRKMDRRAAADHLSKAADSGFSQARYHLAVALFGGQGLKPDPAAALALAQAAAGQGHPEAMRLVGSAYSRGKGVAKDEGEAGVWIRKAADAGSEAGMCALAERLNAGRGMPEDPEEALYWAKKAAPSACGHYLLAVFHRDGRGAAADASKAYEHASRAAHAGHPKAAMLAGQLEQKLAKEEVEALRASLSAEGVAPSFGGMPAGRGAAPFDEDDSGGALPDPGTQAPALPVPAP